MGTALSQCPPLPCHADECASVLPFPKATQKSISPTSVFSTYKSELQNDKWQMTSSIMKSDERIYPSCPGSYSSSIFLINSDFSVNLQPVLCRKSEQMMINWSYKSVNLGFRATFGKGLINVQWVPLCNVWGLQQPRDRGRTNPSSEEILNINLKSGAEFAEWDGSKFIWSPSKMIYIKHVACLTTSEELQKQSIAAIALRQESHWVWTKSLQMRRAMFVERKGWNSLEEQRQFIFLTTRNQQNGVFVCSFVY